MAGSFEKLEVWQSAHSLTLRIYKISQNWPKEEIYGLISQIRRAAVSVELNIAEGQSRYHYAETIRFLYDARASAEEVRNCLILARDLDIISLNKDEFEVFNEEYQELVRRINGLINYFRKRKSV